jgi:hypothetical protein
MLTTRSRLLSVTQCKTASNVQPSGEVMLVCRWRQVGDEWRNFRFEKRWCPGRTPSLEGTVRSDSFNVRCRCPPSVDVGRSKRRRDNPIQYRPPGFGDPELVGVPRDAMQTAGKTTSKQGRRPPRPNRDRTVNEQTSRNLEVENATAANCTRRWPSASFF